MNKSIKTLVSLAAFVAVGTICQAQPAIKLLTVSVGNAYESYWKTKENAKKLTDAQQKAQEQVDELQKQLEAIVAEYKTIEERVNNTALSKDARDKATGEAQTKLREVEAKQEEGQQFIQNQQRSIQLRQKNHRDLMIDEITKVIEQIRKDRGATLVLDTSGPTGIGLSAILYADTGFDITPQVITELNKSQPADFKE